MAVVTVILGGGRKKISSEWEEVKVEKEGGGEGGKPGDLPKDDGQAGLNLPSMNISDISNLVEDVGAVSVGPQGLPEGRGKPFGSASTSNGITVG